MSGSLETLGKMLYGKYVRKFLWGLENPQEAQEECLRRLLTRNQGTVYGRRHKFSKISSPEAYQEQVPLATFDDLKPYFESISQGAENVMYPDKTYCFMITSGTSGDQKYVPISKYGLKEFRDINKIAIARIFTIADRRYYNGHTFNFSAPYVLPEYKYGKYDVGYLTGLTCAKETGQDSAISSQGRMWPSDEVLNMTDWVEKSYRMALEIIPLDIVAVHGLPSNLCTFFRNLVDDITPQLLSDSQISSKIKDRVRSSMHRGKLDLGKLWPNMDIVVYGGIHIDPYLPFLESYFAPITPVALYMATEGYIGLEWYLGEGLSPVLNRTFLEFIPADEPDARPHLVSELKTGKIYSPVMTTPTGFYRYEVGDHIVFTKLDPLLFKIIGRAKTVASLVGERLQESQLNDSIIAACKATGATIHSFMAVPMVTRERTAYDIFIEFRREPKDLAEFEARFDEELRKLNHSYNYERKAGVIHHARFIKLPPKTLEKIPFERTGVGGAGKIPVIGTPELAEKLRNL